MSLALFSLLPTAFHMVPVRYDGRVNQRPGTKDASDFMIPALQELFHLDVCTDYVAFAGTNRTDVPPRAALEHCFIKCWSLLVSNRLPMVIGGDHSLSIASVYASHEYCRFSRKRMGVLWIDACTDIDGPSIRESAVAVLCGLTMGNCQFGSPLEATQFAYYGLRDENSRKQAGDLGMTVLSSEPSELRAWSDNFDMIYVSFDVGVVDPKHVSCARGPDHTRGRCTTHELRTLFSHLASNGKVMSIDLMEFDPTVRGGDVVTTVVNLCHMLGPVFI